MNGCPFFILNNEGLGQGRTLGLSAGSCVVLKSEVNIGARCSIGQTNFEIAVSNDCNGRPLDESIG